jgi:protein ImuB
LGNAAPPAEAPLVLIGREGRRRVVLAANAASDGFTLSQWPSEAKFVAIRIGQVKEPLAPFGITWCRVWSVTGRD